MATKVQCSIIEKQKGNWTCLVMTLLRPKSLATGQRPSVNKSTGLRSSVNKFEHNNPELENISLEGNKSGNISLEG